MFGIGQVLSKDNFFLNWLTLVNDKKTLKKQNFLDENLWHFFPDMATNFIYKTLVQILSFICDFFYSLTFNCGQWNVECWI